MQKKRFFLREDGEDILCIDDIAYIKKDHGERENSKYCYRVYFSKNVDATPWLNENEFNNLKKYICINDRKRNA